MTAPLLLQPHDKDLGGGFNVRRLLPSSSGRTTMCRPVLSFSTLARSV